MDYLKRIMDMYLMGLFKESQRYVKLRALALYVDFLKGSRRMTLLLFFAAVSCMFVGAGIFIVAIQLIYQVQEIGFAYIDSAMGVGLGLIFLGAGSLIWSLSEKRLIKAFKIDKYIHELQSDKVFFEEKKGPAQFSQSDISHMVNILVEDKLKAMVNEAINKQSSEPIATRIGIEDDAPNVSHISDHPSKTGSKIEIH